MSDPQTLDYAAGQAPPPPLTSTMRIRLSMMMFFQYALWGAWWVVLSIYMGQQLGFSSEQVGWVYATMAIASIISPLVFGQIADRWIPAQYLICGCHLSGAVLLYALTKIDSFPWFFSCVMLYALLFIPTISLTNALSFHHIPDAGKDFPSIRVFGTIGWIAAGLFVGWALVDTTAQPIKAACILSAAMGVYALTLPNTPPSGRSGEALAFLKAFALLRHKTFALFILVSFVLSIVLAGYFAFAGPFLKDINIESLGQADTVQNVSSWPVLNRLHLERFFSVASIMTVGQFTEMLLLPFLPFFLKRLGMKTTLALGMAAWGIRYGIFSVGHPLPLIIAAIALHGICYDFFFVAAYIHVDNRATRDMRASAQAFFNLVTMGLGMWIGNIAFGRLKRHVTDPVTEVVDWQQVWLYPALGVGIALFIFIVGFRPKEPEKPIAAT